MRLTIGLAAACLFLIAAEGKDKDKKAGDPLTGTWKVTSLVFGGQEVEQAKGATYVYKDGKLTRKGAMGEQTSAYKLDTSKKPATIDLTVQGGDRDGMKIQGIFEVKGDELKVCVAFMGGGRPTKFDGSEEGQALLTLKRDKGESKEKGKE
jgi:uncharacterized protein (TIGR03067 family)